MAQNYVFTQDDQMNPVYCIGCRAHIPIALSNRNGGLCDACLQQRAQATQQANAVSAAVAAGFSLCPHCHAVKVQSIPQYESSRSTNNGYVRAGLLLMMLSAAFLCCVPWAFFLMFGLGAIFILGGCLAPSRHIVSTTHHCTGCGAKWVV